MNIYKIAIKRRAFQVGSGHSVSFSCFIFRRNLSSDVFLMENSNSYLNARCLLIKQVEFLVFQKKHIDRQSLVGRMQENDSNMARPLPLQSKYYGKGMHLLNFMQYCEI